MNTSFETAKEPFHLTTMLHLPVQGTLTILTSDASDNAIGAVLEQKTGHSWKPLAYFSRTLKKPEQKYATFDHELSHYPLPVFSGGWTLYNFYGPQPNSICVEKVV